MCEATSQRGWKRRKSARGVPGVSESAVRTQTVKSCLVSKRPCFTRASQRTDGRVDVVEGDGADAAEAREVVCAAKQVSIVLARNRRR